eukprot:scaffold271273_cov20-Tisochrysis_lutea.AAC.1
MGFKPDGFQATYQNARLQGACTPSRGGQACSAPRKGGGASLPQLGTGRWCTLLLACPYANFHKTFVPGWALRQPTKAGAQLLAVPAGTIVLLHLSAWALICAYETRKLIARTKELDQKQQGSYVRLKLPIITPLQTPFPFGTIQATRAPTLHHPPPHS